MNPLGVEAAPHPHLIAKDDPLNRTHIFKLDWKCTQHFCYWLWDNKVNSIKRPEHILQACLRSAQPREREIYCECCNATAFLQSQ